MGVITIDLVRLDGSQRTLPLPLSVGLVRGLATANGRESVDMQKFDCVHDHACPAISP